MYSTGFFGKGFCGNEDAMEGREDKARKM